MFKQNPTLVPLRTVLHVLCEVQTIAFYETTGVTYVNCQPDDLFIFVCEKYIVKSPKNKIDNKTKPKRCRKHAIVIF